MIKFTKLLCILSMSALAMSACSSDPAPSSQSDAAAQSADLNTTADQTSADMATDTSQDSADQGLPAPPEQEELSASRANQLATKAYIYAYPAVLLDVTREMFGAAGAPENILLHLEEIPDEDFTAVVRPNTDTLYSTAWLNLKAEPLVLEVPAIPTEERFYMIALLDAWSNIYPKDETPGSRVNNGAATTYFIAGPDHADVETPASMLRIDAPTNVSWLIGRTEVFGPDDVPNVKAIQAQYKLRTWSDYQANRTPMPPLPDYDQLGADPGPAQIVQQMSAQTYYTRLINIMRESPPPAIDAPALAELAELGLMPEYSFDYNTLSDNRRVALERSEGSAMTLIDAAASMSSLGRGWGPPSDIPLGSYGTSYLIRAVVAKIGLGANQNIDARYINAVKDNLGQEFDGTKRYLLHFEPEEIPPVRAFWSLTLYNKEGFLAKDTSSIHTLGSNTDLTFNADGSLDIYIQRLSPSAGKNWLPTPNAPFELTMRMYWPEPSVVEGTWEAPEVKRQILGQ